jgi:hypothetical protein
MLLCDTKYARPATQGVWTRAQICSAPSEVQTLQRLAGAIIPQRVKPAKTAQTRNKEQRKCGDLFHIYYY